MLRDKPEKGSNEEAQLLAEFSRRCRELNWHSAFRALGEDTLLVIDPEVKAALETEFGNLKCHSKSPGIEEALPKGVSRILFLCRDHEWIKVKEARSLAQGVSILSLMYDVAPMGVLLEQEFPREKSGSTTDMRELTPVRNWLLTMPGSDSEYLHLLLEKNNVPSISPLAGKMISSWVLLSSDFRVLRFAACALKHAKQRGGAVHLDMYLTQLVFWHTSLNRKRFFRWFNDAGAHMLYFISRDKARHAGLNEMLAGAPYDSLWDRSESKVRQLEGQKFCLQSALDRLIDMMLVESKLELPMQNIDEFKIISLEDLVVAPQEVMHAVTHFWSLETPRNWQVLDWRARYLALPEFVAQAKMLRKEMQKLFIQ